MKLKKKREEQLNYNSFQANYKHEADAQYPYLLALSLSKASDQFQETRSMKMLGDWVEEYCKLSEIFKYKYSSYIPKIQKILVNKYHSKAPIDYCLSKFLLTFFPTWDELTNTIIENLAQSDRYTLDLLWYTCHYLVEDLKMKKAHTILQYLTTKYQKSLRAYDPESVIEARKIVEIVYLMNIQGAQQPFIKHSKDWSENFQVFQDCSEGEHKLTIIIEIIKNRNLLQSGEQSSVYWQKEVLMFFQILENKVETMSSDDGISKELLNLFLWLLELKEVREMLKNGQERYLKTLLRGSRPIEDRPDHIFHLAKYKQIREILYHIFFESNIEATQVRLSGLLEQFVGHFYSILNKQENHIFLDCLSERTIKLEPNVITDIIKLLSTNHIRRALSAKILIVLAKTIAASLATCALPDQVTGQCLKAFNDSLALKVNDPLIGQMRVTVGKLFLVIMQKYVWEDGYKNQAILGLCQETERNSKLVSEHVLEMLYLMVKKMGFNNQTKLESLLTDIFYKSLISHEHLHSMISLLVVVATNMNFPKATSFIQELCAKNPSEFSNFYLFQALSLTRASSPSSTDFDTIRQIIETPNSWDHSRVDINLMMIEIFFLNLQSSVAMPMLKKIDQNLLKLLKGLYDDGMYRLLSLIAGKIFGAAGDPQSLQSLQSYKWIREYSFIMLARCFYKTTSINVCYIYSNIILRADKPGVTIRWLARQQFLDYLYQGLNDFISKEKHYTQQIVTTLLVYKLIRKQMHLLPPGSRLFQFSTLVKNVTWWDEDQNPIEFVPFEQKLMKMNTSWVLPEFRVHYQQTIKRFFANYFNMYAQKMKRAEEQERIVHEQEI